MHYSPFHLVARICFFQSSVHFVSVSLKLEPGYINPLNQVHVVYNTQETNKEECHCQPLGLLHLSLLLAAAELLQSCPTLCNPIDSSPPGSPVPGILQARTLEWVAISFSNAWKWRVKVKLLIRVRPSATPWTAAYQAPPSMGFSRQEYWSGVPLPSPHSFLRSPLILYVTNDW